MADLIDEIRALQKKIEKSRSLVGTEEATKNAFVMPFISALGYDVFDPTEVTPELVADVGVKKGEKIDYAILRDGKPIMLFECKHHTANLDLDHASQLFRYFACSECRIGVLTNGVEYRLFTDIDAPNKMDSKPFLIFKITEFQEDILPEIKKLTKDAFNIESVLSSANELKYRREIKNLLTQQLNKPSEEFVKFCATGIGINRMTQSVKDQFAVVVVKAFGEFVSEHMNEKLRTVLGASAPQMSAEISAIAEEDSGSTKSDRDTLIVTTNEELECFYAIKSMLNDVVDLKRVFYRDQQSYFSVLLDDNNRKPIARLYLNSKSKMQIGIVDENKKEEKFQLERVDDIYSFAEKIRNSATAYL